MTKNMKEALHRISLASQNSMSSKEECGRIAREALAVEEARKLPSLEERVKSLELAVAYLDEWRERQDRED